MSTMNKLLRQPSFLVAFFVLVLAAVGLNGATQYLKLHFKKLPVPLAEPLDSIPLKLGPWVCVTKDQLSDEVQQELGTDKYVMRYYVNTEIIDPADVQAFDEKRGSKDGARELERIQKKYRNKMDKAIISFAVTYYTGKADTVAHIPERCYTADGYVPTSTNTETWSLVNKAIPGKPAFERSLDFRYLSFEDQVAATRVKRNVAYCFHANGHYTSDPTQVRIELQSLLRKYAYYAKIELMVQDEHPESARESMQNFLVHALPAVEKCLPDYAKVASQQQAE